MSGPWQVQSTLATADANADADVGAPDDAELNELLERAYVDGGFIDPGVAAKHFVPSTVRARGELLYVRTARGEPLAGVAIFVQSSSPGRQFAQPGEAELHLLAVRADQRRAGIGRALVEAVLQRARDCVCERVLLWTQPNMTSAQLLYESLGFRRMPERDFTRGGRQFLFYRFEL